jgi:hypothetical protein
MTANKHRPGEAPRPDRLCMKRRRSLVPARVPSSPLFLLLTIGSL